MPKPIKPEIKEDWIALHKMGIKCSEIAKVYKVSYTTVWECFSEAGIFEKKTTNITLKMIKEWIMLYKTGNETCTSIAKKYNVGRMTVSRYLRMNGIKTYRNRELVENEN